MSTFLDADRPQDINHRFVQAVNTALNPEAMSERFYSEPGASRLDSSDNITSNSRSDDLVISCRANKILKFSRHAFSVLGRCPRMSWSLERLIKGG
jgi:hypothetical protein